jgi:hypothetical protein
VAELTWNGAFHVSWLTFQTRSGPELTRSGVFLVKLEVLQTSKMAELTWNGTFHVCSAAFLVSLLALLVG